MSEHKREYSHSRPMRSCIKSGKVRGVGDEQGQMMRIGIFPSVWESEGRLDTNPSSSTWYSIPSKGFEVAPDPDEETLKTIHYLIVRFKDENRTAPNQTQIIAMVKESTASMKKRLIRLLRKGERRILEGDHLLQDEGETLRTDYLQIIDPLPLYI